MVSSGRYDIYTPGTIAERNKYKQNKYVDIRLGIKNLYPGYIVKLITIVFDFLGAYYKDLDKELNMLFGPKVARLTIERSQNWVISQNCEIVKRFSCVKQWLGEQILALYTETYVREQWEFLVYLSHSRAYFWLLFIILDLHKLIQRAHVYILYPSPHCLGCARNMMLIYTLSYFTNKVYHNNNNIKYTSLNIKR